MQLTLIASTFRPVADNNPNNNHNHCSQSQLLQMGVEEFQVNQGLGSATTTTGLSICLVSIRAPLTNSQRPVFHTYETLSLAL